MDSDLETLTALLLDPTLTVGEAERQAAATPRRDADIRRGYAADRRAVRDFRDWPDSRA